MSASIVFHLLAALGYGLLGAWFWLRLARSHTPVPPLMIAQVCLLVPIVLHGLALFNSIVPDHTLFLGWALALSAAIWLGLMVFWLQNLVLRVQGLLLILLPAAVLASLLAAAFPQGHVVPHANSEWLRIHLLISLTAYGLISIAALNAVFMAALDRQLHRPIESVEQRTLLEKAVDCMPPLLVQERLLFQLIALAFAVLSLTVATGIVVSLRLSSQVLPFDHKTVFTLLSWLTFGGLLWGRHTQGWRGRLALRWTLTGFAFVLLAYTGSRFVMDVLL